MIRAFATRSCARVPSAGGAVAFLDPLLLLGTCFLLAALALPSGAQSTVPQGTGGGAGKITYVSRGEFLSMVKAGTVIPFNLLTLEEQSLALELENEKNRAIVDTYLRQNPQLTDLARLVDAEPDLTRDREDKSVVRRTPDGFSITTVNKNGVSQTFETNGQFDKLSQLAHSIQTLSDPAAQLQLYTALYTQVLALPGYCAPNSPVLGQDTFAGQLNVCNFTPPDSLQGASVETIHEALLAITAQTSQIAGLAPSLNPINLKPVACSAEIGASLSPGVNVGDWGDQTASQGCAPPSSTGIYANFSFQSKNLLSCIRNQGQRGTCHAFAAISAVEELIARDKGIHVNLNEQDFMEREKLLWEAALFHEGGSAWWDLHDAANNNYRFAYENQWDYNPSLFRPSDGVFEKMCEAYPSTEPGCSNTAPEAVEVCVANALPFLNACGFVPATLAGPRSPYGAIAGSVNDVWTAADPYLNVEYIQLGLAVNDAVTLGFNVTDDFQGAPGGYIPYDSADLKTSVGSHFVHIVGFVSNYDLAAKIPSAPAGAGGGYFIIKNSWSACLGDAGYWYMPVSYLEAEANEIDLISAVIE